MTGFDRITFASTIESRSRSLFRKKKEGIRRTTKQQIMPADNRSRQSMALRQQSGTKTTCDPCELGLSVHGEAYSCAFEFAFCPVCALRAFVPIAAVN